MSVMIVTCSEVHSAKSAVAMRTYPAAVNGIKNILRIVFCLNCPQFCCIRPEVRLPSVGLVGVAVEVIQILKTAAVWRYCSLKLFNPGISIRGIALHLQIGG